MSGFTLEKEMKIVVAENEQLKAENERLKAENKRLMQDILSCTKEGIPADEALVDIQSIIEGFYKEVREYKEE